MELVKTLLMPFQCIKDQSVKYASVRVHGGWGERDIRAEIASRIHFTFCTNVRVHMLVSKRLIRPEILSEAMEWSS